MSETYFYSASTNCFYPQSMRAAYESQGGWPADCAEVSGAVATEFMGAAPEGKYRAPGTGGAPAWMDLPEPTRDQLAAAAASRRQALLTAATAAIAPLQDAVDLDMAQEAEKVQLTAWKKYRVLVNRISPADAPDINWPDTPV